MGDALLRRESPAEYFREMVETAMQHQRLAAHDLTSFYLVNLLTAFVPVGAEERDEPLGVRFARALQEGGRRRRRELRQVADRSLFVSGFLSDSLNRSLVDVDYYVQLGEYAYGSLARQDDGAWAEVFDELAAKFAAFADVLGEVSERASLTSNSDVLRLYEKWLRTGSRRSGDLLASRGIVPNASVSSRFLQ
ncbi:MAG: hypothetical protein FJW14_09190 [Acidimicrobiia bacterium]|nr:hypothetical protein [Acidimicrobiia bacterium]